MLGNFSYSNPTRLYFGEDSLNYLNEELPKYGENVLLVYGGGSVCDYAKAVSISTYCREDPWDKYYLRMEDYMKEIGLVMDIGELGVTVDMLDGIADGSFIIDGGYKVLDHGEIVEILAASMR